MKKTLTFTGILQSKDYGVYLNNENFEEIMRAFFGKCEIVARIKIEIEDLSQPIKIEEQKGE